MSRASRWLGCLLLFTAAAPAAALDFDLTPAQIERALRIARGSESGRAAFHERYIFIADHPTVERIEIITEFRRAVLLAEARIAQGDRLFAHSRRAAAEALRPHRGRVSVIARLRFHPQNAYVMAPPIDVTLRAASGDITRLDLRNEPLLAFNSDAPASLLGAVAEAVFGAPTIGQTAPTATVRIEGAELTRLRIDFSRIE